MKADEDLMYIYLFICIYLTVLWLWGNAFEAYAKAGDGLGGAFASASVTNQHAAQAQSRWISYRDQLE